MKARFLALAALVLGLASCQTEPEGLNVNVGGEVDTTITVTIPDTETRYGSDSNSALSIFDNGVLGTADDNKTMRYILEIYYKNELFAERQVDYSDGKTVTFPVRLVAGRKYNFVVWADYVESKNDTDHHYNTKSLKSDNNVEYGLTNVTLNNTWNAMDETRDAFTGFLVVDSYNGTQGINIPLTRPFAKLRVITTDVADLAKLGLEAESAKVVYTTPYRAGFNAATGTAIAANGNDKKTHDTFAIATYGDSKDGKQVLFTDYFFATDEVVKFELAVYDQNNNYFGSEEYIKFNTDIPVKRNYLTTIQGNILTDGNNVSVKVEDAFAQPEIIENLWDGKTVKQPEMDAEGNYLIYEGSELAWIADQVNGVTRAAGNSFKNETIKLMKDINLDYEPWTPIGNGEYSNIFNGTFDGQGHTIANLCVTNVKCAGLFGGTTGGTFKDLTIDGVKLNTNHYAGAIVAWTESGATTVKIENCHVKNAKITVTPELVNGKYDNGDKAGAIVGHSYVTIFDGCSVENVEITAFRDVAGITGYATKGAITNCSVKNATIISNQIHEYDGEKDGNAGVIVGRIGNPVTLTNNNEENVTVKRYVDSTKELEYAVADAKNGDTIYVDGEVVMPYFTEKTINFEGVEEDAVIKQSAATHIDEFYAGATLNFKNVTLVGESYKNNTQGYQKATAETYEKCHFVNYIMFTGKTTTVNECTFANEGQYFWTGTAKNITFNDCKFNGKERAVKVCTVGNHGERIVTFNNCEFTAQAGAKSAIEIDGSQGSSYVVNINNTTATGFAVSEYTGESLFNISAGVENVTIKIDGNTWVGKGVIKDENDNYVVNSLTTLETALEAAGAAGAGDTTIVFAENAQLNMTNVAWTPIKVDGYNGADIVTIEGNGAVITGLTAPLFAGGFAGGSGIVIKDLTIKDSAIVSANTIGSGAFIESVDSMAKIELTNCHLLDSTVTGGQGSRTGGLIGWTAGYSNVNDGPVKTYVTIDGCSVIGCTITCDGSVGGINGHAGNNDWTYTTIKDCTVKNNTLASTDDGEWRVGVVVGTANVGEVTISNITESGNTLTQTGKTAPEGDKRNYYGRFVPGTTGKLTIDGVEVVIINSAENLKKAITNAKAGDTITIAGDITLTEALTLPAGIIFNGNGKQINGTIYAGGNLTFAGHTKVTAFSASYYDRVITIGEGACLEVTGTGRVSLAYGNTFNITGSLENAMTADKTNIQPSLIIPGGISITGGSDATMNITNAYVQIGSTTSKNDTANGVFTLNVTNSIAEFTNQLIFAEPTNGKTPTFNVNIKDSVLTTGTKLIFAAPNCNTVIDNSKVTMATYFRNSGELVVKNGSVVTGTTIQFGENGGNDGAITVDNSKLTINATSTGHALDGKGIGSITSKNDAEVSVTYYKAMTIYTDTTSTFTGTEVQ